MPERKLFLRVTFANSKLYRTHTYSHAERIQILISCTYLNDSVRTLEFFGVVKLLVLLQTLIKLNWTTEFFRYYIYGSN